jgi:hypothetical protein
VFALIPIYQALNKSNLVGLVISLLAMFGSILQHISEVKHGLPGVMFTKYSTILLNIDRITAILSLLYGLYKIYKLPNLLSLILICKFTIGLLCLFLGENIFIQAEEHMIFHTVWHIMAFSCISDIM